MRKRLAMPFIAARGFSALLIAASLGGCVTAPIADSVTKAAADEPLYCSGEQQCKTYWQRAQVWVATNSRWKIQTVTDSLIVTYTPTDYSIELGYQVVKLPLGSGKEQIRIASGCANIFRCNPDKDIAAASFKTFVRENSE